MTSWTYIQSNSNLTVTSATTTAVTINFSTAAGTGHSILGYVSLGVCTRPTMSDSVGNQYHFLPLQQDPAISFYYYPVYCLNVKSSPSSATLVLASNTSFIDIVLEEFSLSTYPVISASLTAYSEYIQTTNSTNLASYTVVPTINNSLVYTFAAPDSLAINPTIPSGFTQGVDINSGFLLSAYMVQSTAQAIQPTWVFASTPQTQPVAVFTLVLSPYQDIVGGSASGIGSGSTYV